MARYWSKSFGLENVVAKQNQSNEKGQLSSRVSFDITQIAAFRSGRDGKSAA
jgi:hypothetical protein